MNKYTLTVASFLIATLSASTVYALDSKSVAAVNGKKITQIQYQEHLKLITAQTPKEQQRPINRQAVLNDLINQEIIFQEAKKNKLHKDKNIKAQLKKVERNLMVQTLLSNKIGAKKISNKELHDVYNKQVANIDPTEYKARHIQVTDEDKAKSLISELNDGANFEELAKKESIDSSNKDGGNIGWFSPARMPPAFAEAANKLLKGTHSQKPVKVGSNYHIIKLEDKRKGEIPKFDQVKEQIRTAVQQKNLRDYIAKLRNKAKIEVK